MHGAMARFVLACVFAFAFLTNATLASAASASCDMHQQGAMASAQRHDMSPPAGDPCCEHASKKACAEACATVCATLVAVANPDVTVADFPVRIIVTPAKTPAFRSADPNGLDPPPKSIA